MTLINNLSMRTSLLLTLDFPPNLGGVATYYLNVCRNFPQGKIKVLVFDNNDKLSLKEENFSVIRVDLDHEFPFIKALKRFSIYFFIFKLLKIIKENKIELLQVGNILPVGTLALMVKKIKKTPFCFYAHGLDILYAQKFPRKKKLMQKIIKEAEFIVANSNFTKAELIKLGATENQVIVAYPCSGMKKIDFTEDQVDEFKKKNGLKNKKIILTVGRLVERKGHDKVIEALSEVIKATPEVVYLIAGTGPYSEILKKKTNELGLEEKVIFLGAVSEMELGLAYAVSDVFIMPSRQLKDGDVEGFGIVFLEANIYDKPAIGGNSGGVAEAIEDNISGLLVDPWNSTLIAEKINFLLSNESLAEKMGQQGAERVEKCFTWEKQTEKIINKITLTGSKL
jgi:phosphatidyl-myo-inositol dimannoside synthase